ncbi:MAG: hypothetical protein A3F09_05815 [Chlamydiae bacterium RIFCSPHIGHO2_12_FULL_49_11]|nr:MAG: hypothetical protein A3F09_05815 [Chlamydiae bacterium RIFCSPHIGHO2_12_FULL_49_11]
MATVDAVRYPMPNPFRTTDTLGFFVQSRIKAGRKYWRGNVSSDFLRAHFHEKSITSLQKELHSQTLEQAAERIHSLASTAKKYRIITQSLGILSTGVDIMTTIGIYRQEAKARGIEMGITDVVVAALELGLNWTVHGVITTAVLGSSTVCPLSIGGAAVDCFAYDTLISDYVHLAGKTILDRIKGVNQALEESSKQTNPLVEIKVIPARIDRNGNIHPPRIETQLRPLKPNMNNNSNPPDFKFDTELFQNGIDRLYSKKVLPPYTESNEPILPQKPVLGKFNVQDLPIRFSFPGPMPMKSILPPGYDIQFSLTDKGITWNISAITPQSIGILATFSLAVDIMRNLAYYTHDPDTRSSENFQWHLEKWSNAHESFSRRVWDGDLLRHPIMTIAQPNQLQELRTRELGRAAHQESIRYHSLGKQGNEVSMRALELACEKNNVPMKENRSQPQIDSDKLMHDYIQHRDALLQQFSTSVEKNPKEAKEILAQMERFYPDDVAVSLMEADLAERRKDYDKMHQAMNKAARQTRSEIEMLENIRFGADEEKAALRDQVTQQKSMLLCNINDRHFQSTYNQVQNESKDRKLKALSQLQQQMQKFPDDLGKQRIYRQAAENAGQINIAIQEQMHIAAKTGTKEDEGEYLILCEKYGRTETALKYYQEGKCRHEENKMRIFRSAIDHDQKSFIAALGYKERMLCLNTLVKQGRLNDAIDIQEKLCKEHPDDAREALTLSRFYLQTPSPKSEFRRFCQDHPENKELKKEWFRSLLVSRDMNEAKMLWKELKPDFQRESDSHSHSVASQKDLIHIYKLMGEDHDAILHWNRVGPAIVSHCETLAPDDPELDSLAAIYLLLEIKKPLRELYEKKAEKENLTGEEKEIFQDLCSSRNANGIKDVAAHTAIFAASYQAGYYAMGPLSERFARWINGVS